MLAEMFSGQLNETIGSCFFSYGTVKRRWKNEASKHIKTLLSRLRNRGSPVRGGIQPRHDDKAKDNGCDTRRKKNTEGGKGDNNQI